MKLHSYKKKLLKNDLKLEKFPEGAIVYVVEDYDIDKNIIYKIGKTDDLNKKIKIYNTHSIHNKQVVHHVEIKCPLQLESWIIFDYSKYRIKNRKEYFDCSFNILFSLENKILNQELLVLPKVVH